MRPFLFAALLLAGTVSAAEPYEVRSGDTLRSIARERLGDASRWRELAQSNDLGDDAIREGQILMLPAHSPARRRLDAEEAFPAAPARRPIPQIEEAPVAPAPTLSAAGSGSGTALALPLGIALAAIWLFFSLSLRGACWFSLVETSLGRCALLAVGLTLLSAGVLAGGLAAAAGALTGRLPLPTGSLAPLLAALWLAAGILLSKILLGCRWRSVITVYVMACVVAGLLQAALWFGIGLAETKGHIPAEYRASLRSLPEHLREKGREAGLPCSAAVRGD